jgi:hypothetical protein
LRAEFGNGTKWSSFLVEKKIETLVQILVNRKEKLNEILVKKKEKEGRTS